MKNVLFRISVLIFAAFVLNVEDVSAQVSSGGIYTINQTVIANGGGTSNGGGLYKVEGTSGQAAAGTLGTGGTYGIKNGFWAPNPFAPTAAGVNVSGRVVGLAGEGLRNVSVILTGGTLLIPRTARTNSFGSFMFEDIEVGQFYTISVQSKKYGFAQPSQIFSLQDSISDVFFQATWEN